MARIWQPHDFDSLYDQFICRDEHQLGGRDYYFRYRSRYKECMKRFAALAPASPINVLDIGGGQLAVLANKLWGDRAVAADLPCPHMDYIRSLGIEVANWDICKCDAPLEPQFDFVFFVEVIEHLPMPGYIALGRIRKIMRPGAIILCSTPNLYRLRNLFYLAIGHPIFDYFQYPDTETSLGHVLEYSLEHLDWQFNKAGFTKRSVEHCHFRHIPTNPLHRPLAILGWPLHLVPHWHDYLIATASAPIGAEL
jgi:2-polyprenyl-3-methyl-5-hydroxy-6-metoxy-1,4-benzoquinol methylase